MFGLKMLPRHTANTDFRDNDSSTWMVKWKITLEDEKNNQLVVDYFQGIGYYEKEIERTPNKYSLHFTGQVSKLCTYGPKKPNITLSSVLECLSTDWAAYGMNFLEWCDCYGYDSDRISHRDIYDSCVKSARDAIKAFGRTKFDEILNFDWSECEQ